MSASRKRTVQHSASSPQRRISGGLTVGLLRVLAARGSRHRATAKAAPTDGDRLRHCRADTVDGTVVPTAMLKFTFETRSISASQNRFSDFGALLAPQRHGAAGLTRLTLLCAGLPLLRLRWCALASRLHQRIARRGTSSDRLFARLLNGLKIEAKRLRRFPARWISARTASQPASAWRADWAAGLP
jgi:hypothetical protein